MTSFNGIHLVEVQTRVSSCCRLKTSRRPYFQESTESRRQIKFSKRRTTSDGDREFVTKSGMFPRYVLATAIERSNGLQCFSSY